MPGHLAAQPRCRQCLARVAEIAWVERVAHPAHHVDGAGAEHLRHVARLVRSDTVLAGDRATGRDARLEDLPRHLERAIAGAGLRVVEEHERMEVAVAGVKDVGDAQPVRRRQCIDLLEHIAQARARDDAVLHVVARADPAHRGERGLARFPDQRSFDVVGRDADLGRAACGARVDDFTKRRIRLDGRPVELDDQRGAAVGIPGVHRLLARHDREPIHHLDGGGCDARGDDSRHRLAGVAHAVNAARTVCVDSGTRTMRSTTSVTMPRVPSLPMTTPSRS